MEKFVPTTWMYWTVLRIRRPSCVVTALKRPWRQSNCRNTLRQMLLTNQRLKKLKAERNDFIPRGPLPPSHALPKPVLMPDEDDEGQ